MQTLAPAHDLGHVVPLFERTGLGRIARRLPPRVVWAVYVFVNGFVTIALLAMLAGVTDSPFIFPSLGPTAYLLFFTSLAESSSPRNTILGHAIGLVCGYGALVATQSLRDWAKVTAAALSLAATGALMVLLRAGHPPAGATTLIVSLGIISKPSHLIIIEGAVFLLTLQAFAINRTAGLPYPLWEHPRSQAEPPAG